MYQYYKNKFSEIIFLVQIFQRHYGGVFYIDTESGVVSTVCSFRKFGASVDIGWSYGSGCDFLFISLKKVLDDNSPVAYRGITRTHFIHDFSKALAWEQSPKSNISKFQKKQKILFVLFGRKRGQHKNAPLVHFLGKHMSKLFQKSSFI